MLRSFLKSNPVPLVALVGVVGGAILRWPLANPEASDWVLLAALVVGGAPLVWHTLVNMARGHFASDVVATLAIVGAVVMDEPFAGLIVVLMQSGGEALD